MKKFFGMKILIKRMVWGWVLAGLPMVKKNTPSLLYNLLNMLILRTGSFNYGVIIHVDIPKHSIIKTINISGLCFHRNKKRHKKIIKLILHVGDIVSECQYPLERKDLNNMYSEFPHSYQSGFNAAVNLSSVGENLVWFEVLLSNGDIIRIDTGQTVYVEGFCLDQPDESKMMFGEKVTFSGWYFHEQERAYAVILHIDDCSYECTYNLERIDVRNNYKEYKFSGKSGFFVDLFLYFPGERYYWFEILLENGRIINIKSDNVLNILNNNAKEYLTSSADIQRFDYSPATLEISKNVGFTIIGKNYVHYALTLRESFLKHNPDYEFIIVFMDLLYEKDECNIFHELYEQGIEFIFWPEVEKYVQIDSIDHMLLKYNVHDMIKAVKPFVFEYLFNCGHEKIIYLQPDIYCKSQLSNLTNLLDIYDIIISPNSYTSENHGSKFQESDILLNKINYSGLIGMRMSSKSIRMCKWWEKKLYQFKEETVDCPQTKHYVLKDKGYDLTPWNLYKGKLSKRNDKWYSGNDKLVLFNFSGLPLQDFNSNDLFNEYLYMVLEKDPERYKGLNYYFDYIPKTRIKIPDIVRKNYQDILYNVPAPFKPDETYVKKNIRYLTADIYSDGSINKIGQWIWNIRSDLQTSFPDMEDKHIRTKFKEWFLSSSQSEYGLHEVLQQVNKDFNINDYKIDSPGVNIIGYFSQIFGIAEAARAFSRLISKAGIPFSIFDVDTQEHQKLTDEELTEFKPLLSEKPIFDINMFFITADQIICNTSARFPYLFKEKYNIGMFWWELEDYFQEFIKAFDYIDHVVVFTDFIKKAVEKALPSNVKITKLPYPYIENWKIISSRSEVRKNYGLMEDDFVFMYNFDFFSTVERKNPEAVIKAFSSAFSNNKNARLLLKTSHSEKCPDKLKYLLSEIEKFGITNNVIMIQETLSRNQIMSLTNAADCYVSLHRSEGLGLGMLEAMYLGKPVIATRYGGNLDFMNDDNSILVNYSMTAIEKDCLPYKKGWLWAEPDVDEASVFMAKLYEDQDYAFQLGCKAEDSVKKHFDSKLFTKKLYELLESL